MRMVAKYSADSYKQETRESGVVRAYDAASGERHVPAEIQQGIVETMPSASLELGATAFSERCF